MVVDEMRRAAEAGELVITRRQPFPLIDVAMLATLPICVVVNGVSARVPPCLYVGDHAPEPAQLRTAARRRWKVRPCGGLAPHYHCPRCGCGHVLSYTLPAEVDRPCRCGCHPSRRLHGGVA